MATTRKGAGNSALFLDPAHCTHVKVSTRKSDTKVPHTDRSGKKETLLPGIVDGKRVLIVDPPRLKELEKGIEIRIRVALATAGVMVMKHHVDNRRACPQCSFVDAMKGRTGLGIGVSDLICVVPPSGRFLGIEVKRPGEQPRDDQKRWLAVVKRFGGVTGVASSVDEAMALVAEARR